MAKELTTKQRLFVAEYLTDLNATRAATAAGYSEKSAFQQGCALLKNPKVAAIIARKQGKRLEKLEITADRVLSELARLAYYDPRQFFNPDGTAKPITDLDDDTAMALAGVEVQEEFKGRGEHRQLAGYTKKFKLVDKGINLERLGRHLKLFTDKAEIAGANGGPISFVLEHVGR
jgi:phage terminase small subunit